MQYFSTRGAGPVTLDTALRLGIASDGGLFLPEKLPSFALRGIPTAADQWGVPQGASWRQVSLTSLFTQVWLGGSPGGGAFPVKRDDGAVFPGPEGRDEDSKSGWSLPSIMWRFG